MVNPKDTRVVSAMGSKFEQFQTIARMAKEHPETRSFCEAKMAKLLETMTETERKELRAALVAAGAKGAR